MKKRVAILISGGGSNMEALLHSMQMPDHPAEPVLVLSSDSRAAGLNRARALGIRAASVDHVEFGNDRRAFDSRLQEHLLDAGADIICLAGFMRILSANFVTGWRGRILNIHPSLLPKYPGLRTHDRAIAAGDFVHGASVHEVIPDLDAGPVLGQVAIPILAGDTAKTLAARLLPHEHRLYPAVLHRFALGDRTRRDLP